METVRVHKKAWLLLAALLALAGSLSAAPLQAEIDEAQRRRALALNDVTGDETIKGQVKSLADDPEGSRKLLKTAMAMTKEKGKEQPFNFNAAYVLAQTAEELKDLNAGQTFYRICTKEALKLKSASKLGLSYLGLAELQYANKKYADAEKTCKEVLELPDDEQGLSTLKAQVMTVMIQATHKQGKTEQARKLLDNFFNSIKGPNWVAAYQIKGDILRELGDMAEAAKTYEAFIRKMNNDKAVDPERRSRQLERSHYILSGVYVELNQVDKAAEHLKVLLGQKPDNPTYNNDLGYIWADHDMNLDEAEKLVRKALEEDRKQRKNNADAEEDKDSSAYLDSLGWVLFKKKKFKEAKEPLLKAIEDKEGQHIEILDHLGDVYIALGEKDEAVKVWKKGLEVAGESKREQEKKAQVEKKLKAAEEKKEK